MKKEFIFIPVSLVLIIITIVSFLLISSKPQTSNVNKALKIAEYTKPAVVRVIDIAQVEWSVKALGNAPALAESSFKTIVGGTGSGAIISSDGYIITNAHVVAIAKASEQDIYNQAFNQLVQDISQKYNIKINLNNYEVKAVSLQKATKVLLAGGKLMDAEIKGYGAPIGEGKDVAVIKIELNNLPTIKLGDSSKVNLQDSIWVFGYPGAADSKDLLSQDSALVVSINDGKISATDKKSVQGSPVIQVTAATTHGNSGGPVVAEDDSIIGLLTFRGDEVNGQEVQGFNFAVPVNTVKEYVNQSGAKNEGGQVDILYKEGLELYWGGYYNDAIIKFENVQRLFPEHSEVKRFITDCQAKSPQSKILWSKYSILIVVIDFVILLLLSLLTFVVMTRNTLPKAALSQISDNSVSRTNGISDSSKAYNPSPLLCGVSGLFAGNVFELNRGSITIGRDPNGCQVVFPQATNGISRRHCSVSYDKASGNFILQDEGSSYGTFLASGEKLTAGRVNLLKAGNRFYVGDQNNMFEFKFGK